MERKRSDDAFCRTYLQTMDPDRAARASGRPDGFSALGCVRVQERLERMRENAAGQLRREDALRRLAQLAFGGAEDAVYLALHPQEADPAALDLAAVTELRVTDKGVEVKLTDRVRALETLCALLESGPSRDADALYQALAESAGGEGEWDHG